MAALEIKGLLQAGGHAAARCGSMLEQLGHSTRPVCSQLMGCVHQGMHQAADQSSEQHSCSTAIATALPEAPLMPGQANSRRRAWQHQHSQHAHIWSSDALSAVLATTAPTAQCCADDSQAMSCAPQQCTPTHHETQFSKSQQQHRPRIKPLQIHQMPAVLCGQHTRCSQPSWSPWPSGNAHRHLTTTRYSSSSSASDWCGSAVQGTTTAGLDAAPELAALTQVCAASPSGPPKTSLLYDAASAIQWVHDNTGLPWWMSIPLTTWMVRTTLLPFSMWQAKTVRTNFMVYKEAVSLTDKQLGSASQAEDGSTAGVTARRPRLLLANFVLLRSKLGAPHPAWILINPLVQLPVFALLGATLRMMGGVSWPGLTTGGTAWFTDLTQVAVIPGSLLSEQATPWTLPMGLLGPVLPLVMLSMTLASLKIGFGAAGAGAGGAAGVLQPGGGDSTAPPQDWVGRGMRVLPYVLGGLAVLNTWVAMQMPHAALMHWLASSSFTLGLQLALQRPAFRAAFNLPSPAEIQASLSRAVNQRLLQLSEAGGVIGPGRGYAVSSLPDALVKQVSSERDADVLVIMGAQHSAQKRYREALYCLDRALQLQPQHVRAHYSRGQVFSLNNRWVDAEACFRRAADLAAPGPEKGQAQYCVATALHTQGKLDDALVAYREAMSLWKGQVVVAYSLATALTQAGRLHEALAVVAATLHVEPQALSEGSLTMNSSPAGPFHKPLLALADQINKRLKGAA